jgi:hypothetical protein
LTATDVPASRSYCPLPAELPRYTELGVIVDAMRRNESDDSRVLEVLPYAALPTFAVIGVKSCADEPIASKVVWFSIILDPMLKRDDTTAAVAESTRAATREVATKGQ